jgi:reactive intermediate/imine deaminase
MTKKAIHTASAPAAIGPYSQAIATTAAQTVYLSGQIPLDPDSLALVSTDFTAQAHQVFANLNSVAGAAGGSLADCVKLTIYLVDLSQFQTVNDVMSTYFEEPYPARAAIEVSALPKGAAIEIDAIMALL